MRYIKSKSMIRRYLNRYLNNHNMSVVTFASEFLTPYKAGYILGVSEFKPRFAKWALVDAIMDDCIDRHLRKSWNNLLKEIAE